MTISVFQGRLHGIDSPPGPSRKSSKNENRTKDDLDEKMKSNAAHIFVISQENLTIRLVLGLYLNCFN